MFRIGLTGGIGSGKSRVADMLGALGAAIIDTDIVAHALTAPGGQAMPAIAAAFGPAVVAPDGSLDRRVMRELVFADERARARLEAILHPMIYTEVRQLSQAAHGVYLVYVVPLLVESGKWRDRVDRICVVDCDPATQLARVGARSGLTPEVIQRIMGAQATREARLAVADDVVCNDAHTPLEALADRVRALHQRWVDMAAQART